MWHAVHASLKQHLREDAFVSVQLTSKAKVLTDLDAAQEWLLQAKFELEVMGLKMNTLMSPFQTSWVHRTVRVMPPRNQHSPEVVSPPP